MKRSIELEFDVQEIVKIGKTRDKEGAFLYPVMAEPAVMAFFGAADALYEVITQRPILLLNLLQVNKALSVFWNQCAGDMWIKIIDMLIEKEMGMEAREIYPFIAVENHRRVLLLLPHAGRVDRLVVPFIGYQDEISDFRTFDIRYLTTIHTPVSPIFYVVYYDTLTQLYMDLMMKIRNLRNEDNELRYLKAIKRYLLMPQRLPVYYVEPFSDCFLVAKSITSTNQPFSSHYDVDAMREDLITIKNALILQTGELPAKSLVLEAHKLIDKLTTMLEEGVRPDKPVLIKLDKTIVTPYRTLLYDSVQGLVKTRAEQKAFLMELLLRLNKTEHTDLLVEKYGQPLTCSMCQCETQLVDPMLMRAFCSDGCHSLCHEK